MLTTSARRNLTRSLFGRFKSESEWMRVARLYCEEFAPRKEEKKAFLTPLDTHDGYAVATEDSDSQVTTRGNALYHYQASLCRHVLCGMTH